MRRVKIHRWGNPGLQRFMPTSHAKTPAVSLLQSGKAGLRGYQIVAACIREFEELIRHLSTNRVEAEIAWAGAAVTISVKTGKRITAAAAQLSTKNVRWHRTP
jgi:hypothetical protein